MHFRQVQINYQFLFANKYRLPTNTLSITDTEVQEMRLHTLF